MEGCWKPRRFPRYKLHLKTQTLKPGNCSIGSRVGSRVTRRFQALWVNWISQLVQLPTVDGTRSKCSDGFVKLKKFPLCSGAGCI
jgi:hypothetical protein